MSTLLCHSVTSKPTAVRETKFIAIAMAFLLLITLLSLFSLTTSQLLRSQLQQVIDPTIANPANVGFHIYIPAVLASPSPPIVVAIHFCNGNASRYFSYAPSYPILAEKKGFILIYPSSPNSGSCWDVSSRSTLTHRGGGDSNTIVNFVTWTITTFHADPSRVFATGTSSGGMMTNVLAATYPDVFAAGVVYSGVGPGCFVSEDDPTRVNRWNSSCAEGRVNAEPEHWARVVRGMYPEWKGGYPRMQVYHGDRDDVLFPSNYNETVKAWAGVFGYRYPAQRVVEDTPVKGYRREEFGERLQGFYAEGVGHNVPIRGEDDMAFFGI